MFSGLFAFIGRLMLALIFIVAGAAKLADIAGTGQYMASVGLPANLALPAALFELIAGICLALGIFTRIFSLLLAGFCLLTALLFHRETADPMQATMAMKNIAMAGGYLCLFAYGQAAWSLDAMRQRRKDEAARQPTENPGVGAG
jgi:putative oxidoreductase